MRYLVLLFSFMLIASDKIQTVEQHFSVNVTSVKKVTTSKMQKNYGYVRLDESKVFSVTPRFGGYIETLYADTIYKYVKKGDVLAKVYSPEVLSAKEEYLASINYSKSGSNSEMIKSSKEKLLLLNVSEIEIASIKSTLNVSKFTKIYAPKSGYIFTKNISNLDAFKAKQKLFEIVDLDSVWVEVKVNQKELNTLSKLELFKVKAVGVDKVYEAKKNILYPSINDKESHLILRLDVKNANHLLKNGMYVEVESSAKEKEYLTLPSSAVIRKNNSFYVFVVGEYEGEYEPLEVGVKVLDSNTYIVEDGLKEGEEVVNSAMFMMDSDAQINGLY